MPKTTAAPKSEPKRLLDLNPDRAKRVGRPPFAIVDIGSNSVRLVVYDQLGRAPMPRFNEKSLCRLGEKLAETGLIQPDNFRSRGRSGSALPRHRRRHGRNQNRRDRHGGDPPRDQRPGACRRDPCRVGLEVRILSGAEEARYGALGVVSGFFRPVGSVGDMGRRQPRNLRSP